MLRLVVFICAFLFLDIATCDPIRSFNPRNERIYVVNAKDVHNTCTNDDATMWSHEFHNCFIDRKYGDGGKDLNNIVDRILDHSRDCVGNYSKKCRPNFGGFMVIMDKVIYEMKDYCFIYLESIIHGRGKIKDLECVESSLSNGTYKTCFEALFARGSYKTEGKFQKEVEKAICCTNKSNKLCSKTAKTSLNRIVRTILGVQQPDKEDIEDDVKPKPPKMWYDYIFQPFIYMWRAFRSFFGF